MAKATRKAAKAAPRRRAKGPGRSATRQASQPPQAPPADGVVTIRKYANRRLYDTSASAHITQDDLYRMVGQGAMVRILDATSGEDITNQTLATALIEHDPGKLRLVPAWLLHQMIRLHEQAIGGWLSTLWPALAGDGSGRMPGWAGPGGLWPGGGSMGLGTWTPWSAAAAAEPDGEAGAAKPGPASRDKVGRKEGLDELRREAARLLRRLGEMEE